MKTFSFLFHCYFIIWHYLWLKNILLTFLCLDTISYCCYKIKYSLAKETKVKKTFLCQPCIYMPFLFLLLYFKRHNISSSHELGSFTWICKYSSSQYVKSRVRFYASVLRQKYSKICCREAADCKVYFAVCHEVQSYIIDFMYDLLFICCIFENIIERVSLNE